ncbi:MAG: hypothetical protein GDA36_10625 [Rhodobacteraceae bacterium]|nr:hypothetical protein [Paracoccaceae bacterium]
MQTDRYRDPGVQNADFFVWQLDDMLTDQNVPHWLLLLGYSMGGVIATAFTVRTPNRISHPLLIAHAGMSELSNRRMLFIRDTPVISGSLMLTNYPRSRGRGLETKCSVESSVAYIPDGQLEELKKNMALFQWLSAIFGTCCAHGWNRNTRYWPRPVCRSPHICCGHVRQSEPGCVTHDVVDGAGCGLTYAHVPQVLAAIRCG